MTKSEIIKLLRERRLDDLMEDLEQEAYYFDCSVEKLLDFGYGWDETHLAQCLIEDFPNKYFYDEIKETLQ